MASLRGCWERCEEKAKEGKCSRFTWNEETKVCRLYNAEGGQRKEEAGAVHGPLKCQQGTEVVENSSQNEFIKAQKINRLAIINKSIPAFWSPWSAWSDCSCPGAKKSMRRRECLKITEDENCDGQETEIKSCFLGGPVGLYIEYVFGSAFTFFYIQMLKFFQIHRIKAIAKPMRERRRRDRPRPSSAWQR